jgi:hypothetical protein
MAAKPEIKGSNLRYPFSVLSRTERGHGIFFLKGHFARRIYQKGHIEKNRVGTNVGR